MNFGCEIIQSLGVQFMRGVAFTMVEKLDAIKLFDLYPKTPMQLKSLLGVCVYIQTSSS